MKILPVNKHTIDVFQDKDWDNWARFKINRTHQGINLYQIQGEPVSKKTKQTIINEITK